MEEAWGSPGGVESSEKGNLITARTMPMRMDRWTAALLAVLLVGFALRVIQLDQRPLWWDEGNNVYFATRDLGTVIEDTRITRDTNPPVHRLALGLWADLAGSSTFAMRYFSAVAGITIVALSWAVGRWLTDRPTALVLVVLVALAPMQVYYAREAKGYTLAAAFGLLSTYAWGRGLGGGTRPASRRTRKAGWWATYVLSTAAAVGTHYYLAPLLLWQGLWTAGRAARAWIQRLPRRKARVLQLRRWVLAAGVSALLLVPWVVTVFGPTVNGVRNVSGPDPLSPIGYARETTRVFLAGEGQAGFHVLVAVAGLTALAGLGALSGGTGGFLLSWIAVPLVAAYLLQRSYSFFTPRFLLYLGPPCYLLISRGITAIGRVKRSLSTAVALLLVVAIIALWAPGLAHVYARPVDPDEDPTPVITYLRALARPDDAMVYGYIWQVGYVLGHFPRNPFSFYRAYWTPQTVTEELTSIVESHPRVWRWSYEIGARDPNNLACAWLDENAYRVESRWYGRHNLALYLAPDFRTPGVGPDAGTASFGGGIELEYPMVDATLQPGDVLALPLRWRASSPVSEDHRVFVHVGLPNAPPIAQDDGQPCNGLEPTGEWEPGQEVLDHRALSLPRDVPLGRYLVRVGLYRASDGSRLPLSGGDEENALILGSIEVAP